MAKWPEGDKPDPVVIGEMSLVREFVSIALEARAKNNIKVRQPLPALRINIELEPEYATVLADEINVKQVVAVTEMKERAELDTDITPELKQEGDARELMRAIQSMRKEKGLETSDRISLTIQTSDGGEAVVNAFSEEIKQTVGAESIDFGDANGVEVKAGKHEFTIEIEKL